jgi:hypothetical protein
MKHLIIINLFETLYKLVWLFDKKAVFDYHWMWKIYPKKSYKWCVDNYGSVINAKRVLMNK